MRHVDCFMLSNRIRLDLYRTFSFQHLPTHLSRCCFLFLLQTLVASLVLSKLDYGCATLAGLPVNLLNRLQSLLNAAARLICGRRKYDHVTPLLRELHWLRVPERITFRLATLAYRCQHNMAPHYLASSYIRRVASPLVNDCARHQRQTSSFRILHARQSAIVHSAARAWNTLTASVQSSESQSFDVA